MYTNEEIKALNEERTRLVQKAEEIHTRVKESKKAMSPEDAKAFDEAMCRVEEIKSLLETDKRLASAIAATKESAAPPAKADPQARIVMGAEREDLAPGAFGRFLKAVRRAGEGDATLITRELARRAAAGGAETPPGSGGFAVDKPTVAKIVDIALATGILPPLCEPFPITVGSGVKFPVVDTSSEADASRPFRGYWVDEAGTITASTPKWKKESLDLKKLCILAPATDEFLEDAPFAESFYTSHAGAEFGFCLDEAIYRGSGAGAPLGALSAPCTVSVAKDAAQDADTISATNLVNMRKRLIPGEKYIVLYSLDMLDQLVFLVHPTAGTPLWLPAGSSLVNKENDTILGMPAFPFTHCSALGDKGDVLMGAFGKYMLAKKGDVQADTSIHVYFDTAQTVFRFMMRVDGMPELPKAITPRYATANTLSHFVTLDARA